MNPEEKETFNRIIAGFEQQRKAVESQPDFPVGPMADAGYYQSCLRIVRDGPRMKSRRVQEALIKHYDDLLQVEYKKLLPRS